MSKPEFIIRPITDTEKETSLLLLQDLTVKQIQDLKFLSFSGLESQTKRIRTKMQASTIYGAIGRMVALGILSKEEIIHCLPPEMKQFIR